MIGRRFRVCHENSKTFTTYTCCGGYVNGEVYLINDNNIILNISHLFKDLTEKNVAQYILNLPSNKDCESVTTLDGCSVFGRYIQL